MKKNLNKIFTLFSPKQLIWSIKLGLDRSNSIPRLPRGINKYYSHPKTKNIRFFGGIITCIVLYKISYHIPSSPLDFILIFIALIQLAQMIIISIIKIIYSIYIQIKYPEIFDIYVIPIDQAYISQLILRIKKIFIIIVVLLGIGLVFYLKL